METLLQDIRFAIRNLRRNPAFAITAVLMLAVGIGANTAIFSTVDAVLFRSLPYKDPDRLMLIWRSDSRSGHQRRVVHPADFDHWRDYNQVFDQMAAYIPGVGLDLAAGGPAERVPAAIVSANFFSLLGVRAQLGRTFLPSEEAPGSSGVALLSHRLWQRQFGLDPGVAGRTMVLNGRAYSIVGVMPAHLDFPSGVELWVPGPRQAEEVLNLPFHATYYFHVLGRLKSGVTLKQARTHMAQMARQFEPALPQTQAGMTVQVVRLHAHLVKDVRLALFILWAAIAFVLLIACANVANL